MVIEMLDTTDFFQEQIKQCKIFAARSTNKNDRDFWQRMADRWEGLFQARQPGASLTEAAQKFSFQRLRFAKRRRAA